MKLGFVTAILPDQPLEEIVRVAADIGYQCIEVMCWPTGKSDRRYAGVTHIDAAALTPAGADDVRALLEKHGVEISGLGYYPNPLAPITEDRGLYAGHLRQVFRAAKLLGLENVNTFIGRDWTKSVEDNWPDVLKVWKPLVAEVDDLGLRLGIENCPMLFGKDEWPGGKNLAVSPAIWRRLFADIPSPNFGLNLDPSHLTWLMIDPVPCIREFAGRLFHIHAKDARIDRDKLQDVGILGLDWHTPKLPGLGDVDWRDFFGALTDARFNGSVCVEVEDRAFETTLAERKRSLVLSHRYLSQFVA